MRGPDGGSVHDPSRSDRPGPMWERRTTAARTGCQLCAERGRPRHKRQIRVDAGPQPGTYLICPWCDGTAGAVPPELRSGGTGSG